MDMSMTSGDMGSTMMGTQTASSGLMPTPTAGMSSSMDMGAGSCKISMLWNWNTVDACFISSSWHVTSDGMFAGSCIGVICLVCSLEFLRRLGREYDRYVALNAQERFLGAAGQTSSASEGKTDSSRGMDKTNANAAAIAVERSPSSSEGDGQKGLLFIARQPSLLRPTLAQQCVRVVLHTLQFGVAYFIMLLAMYYNGYIIICILLGAAIGAFIFSWDLSATSATNVSGCCGEN